MKLQKLVTNWYWTLVDSMDFLSFRLPDFCYCREDLILILYGSFSFVKLFQQSKKYLTYSMSLISMQHLNSVFAQNKTSYFVFCTLLTFDLYKGHFKPLFSIYFIETKVNIEFFSREVFFILAKTNYSRLTNFLLRLS